MPSKAEMKHLSNMANIIRVRKEIKKDLLIVISGTSIAWGEKLSKYIPILFKDIEYNKKTQYYNTLYSLSE